jgi:hypothetical protein
MLEKKHLFNFGLHRRVQTGQNHNQTKLNMPSYWRDFDGDGKLRDLLTGPLHTPDTATVQQTLSCGTVGDIKSKFTCA